MKAISVKQPWASMIAQGKKTIETRTWTTKHRGEILIVASKAPEIDGLPVGLALCVAEIIDCRPMIKPDESCACCKKYDDVFSWILKNIKPVIPFPVQGRLGLYQVDTPFFLS